MKKILYIMAVLVFSFSEAKAIENNCPNPNIADVFYADGTCSADYIPSKNAIGIIYWLGAIKKGGLIMSLDEPSIMSWEEAIRYCQTYSKSGISGWKLPEISEFIPMGIEKPLGYSNNKYNILKDKLASISEAKKLENSMYWSNSVTNASYTRRVWRYNPMDGNIQADSFNYVTLNLRCVLAF